MVIDCAVGRYWLMFGAQRVIEAHIAECKVDRQRTADQFSSFRNDLHKLEEKLDHRFQETDRERAQQHAENQAALSKIMRYIWMAIGGGGVITFLASDWGQGVLQALQHGVHHGAGQ